MSNKVFKRVAQVPCEPFCEANVPIISRLFSNLGISLLCSNFSHGPPVFSSPAGANHRVLVYRTGLSRSNPPLTLLRSPEAFPEISSTPECLNVFSSPEPHSSGPRGRGYVVHLQFLQQLPGAMFNLGLQLLIGFLKFLILVFVFQIFASQV